MTLLTLDRHDISCLAGGLFQPMRGGETKGWTGRLHSVRERATGVCMRRKRRGHNAPLTHNFTLPLVSTRPRGSVSDRINAITIDSVRHLWHCSGNNCQRKETKKPQSTPATTTITQKREQKQEEHKHKQRKVVPKYQERWLTGHTWSWQWRDLVGQ